MRLMGSTSPRLAYGLNALAFEFSTSVLSTIIASGSEGFTWRGSDGNIHCFSL